MQFTDLIQCRYSVRAYRSDPVGDEQLQAVLETARLAPTAANRQAFRLVLIHTSGRQEELAQIYHREWFSHAPLVICVCSIPAEAWRRASDQKSYADVDAAIVMDHITLAAADQGLGTCWIANFNPVAAREVLGLPDEVEPVVFTPLGYPADSLRPKERKPLENIIRWEHW